MVQRTAANVSNLPEKIKKYKSDHDESKFNSIQFNSIHVYLRANLTAQMPITKLARERRKRQ
jgi:hypothetical protein